MRGRLRGSGGGGPEGAAGRPKKSVAIPWITDYLAGVRKDTSATGLVAKDASANLQGVRGAGPAQGVTPHVGGHETLAG